MSTIANSDVVGAWAANMRRAVAGRMELDIKGMLGPRVGQVWEQTKGPLKGRRGLVVSAGHRVRLTPVPGLCQCPAKQRTTAILRRRFAGAWRLEVDCV